jgi:hypothetical protein
MFVNRLPSITLALYLALRLATADATPATLSVSQSGREILVFATAQVAADNGTAWDVLTGYDHLPKFIPCRPAARSSAKDRTRWCCSRDARASGRSSRNSA